MIFDPDLEWVALWGLALLATSFVCVPMLLGALGLTRVRKTCEWGGEYSVPPGAEDEYVFYTGQLRALGFEPIGLKCSDARFFAYHWRWRCTTQVFASRRHGCFALVYQLAHGDGLRACFMSVFADGSMVCTSNSMKRLKIEEDDYLRRGLPTTDLDWLLNNHLEMVARPSWSGRGAAPLDLEFLTERDEYFERRHLATRHRDLPWGILMIAAVLIGVPAAIGAYFFGVDHWMTPALTFLAAVCFRPIMTSMRNQGSREIRKEDSAASVDDDSAAPGGGRPNEEGIRRNENEMVTGGRG
jgi:hypothetical protein